jgi:uridine monophosphate synthetase
LLIFFSSAEARQHLTVNTMAANSDLPSISHATLGQSYCERSYHPDISPLAAYLLRLMHFKQTNLCVSADVTTSAELLRVAEEVGDHICILKTHADIVRDFGDRTIRGLNEVARRRKFLVFEDRKFGDIGSRSSSNAIHSGD